VLAVGLFGCFKPPTQDDLERCAQQLLQHEYLAPAGSTCADYFEVLSVHELERTRHTSHYYSIRFQIHAKLKRAIRESSSAQLCVLLSSDGRDAFNAGSAITLTQSAAFIASPFGGAPTCSLADHP
jgi:hypothetical protein